MNKVILMGRMTADPVVTQTASTTIARFTVAVPRVNPKEGQPDADFIRCVAFGRTAENISKYFGKATRILIDGRLQISSYQNQEGKTAWSTDIIVERFDFCDSKPANTQDAQGQGYPAAYTPPAAGNYQPQAQNYQGTGNTYTPAATGQSLPAYAPPAQNNYQQAPNVPSYTPAQDYGQAAPTSQFTPYQPATPQAPLQGNAAPMFNPSDIDGVEAEVPFR